MPRWVVFEACKGPTSWAEFTEAELDMLLCNFHRSGVVMVKAIAELRSQRSDDGGHSGSISG